MIEIVIPGYHSLQLEHLVLDYNGTLAVDGRLIRGVARKLAELSQRLRLHIITADTHGTAARHIEGIACQLSIIPPNLQAEAKRDFVQALGAEQTVCVGNGRNDRLMLEAASLGIAIIQDEGASGEAVRAADVIVHSIHDALDLLLNPLRLVATLRS